MQGAFYEVKEGLEGKRVSIRVLIEDIELGVVPRCSHTQHMLSFHPARGGPVLPLILDHATIAKGGAGTKLQTTITPIDRRVRCGNGEIRKSRRAWQAHANRTCGESF